MTAPLPDWFDIAQTERLLREKYAPILSVGDYARLREKCGLGEVIDGEVAVLPRIDSLEVAAMRGNAMVNDDGDVFYPDSPEDAEWFAEQHGARPLPHDPNADAGVI